MILLESEAHRASGPMTRRIPAPSTISWDDVRYLEAIQRAGSVARAARELGVSASTVYRRIAALETAVGSTCLARGSGHDAVTETGAALALVGGQTRDALNQVTGAVRAHESTTAGEVSLTTVEGFLPFLLDPLKILTASHPELRVTLHLGDSGPSVRNREVDVALGVMRHPPKNCWGRRLLRYEYGVFGTREACARRPRPRWVTLGPPMLHTPEAAWERENADDVVLTTGSYNALVHFLLASVGIGLLPRPIAQLHATLIELKDFRESVAGLEREVWLLTHPDLRRNARVVALMDALTKALSSLGSP